MRYGWYLNQGVVWAFLFSSGGNAELYQGKLVPGPLGPRARERGPLVRPTEHARPSGGGDGGGTTSGQGPACQRMGAGWR